MRAQILGTLAVLVACLHGSAHGAPDAAQMSSRPAADAPASLANLSAYRRYAMAQANTLVGMTRALANELNDGNLDSAPTLYAPAHRYLARIEPILRHLGDLQQRMDGLPDTTGAVPSGFHRLEHGLFTKGPKADLAAIATRLDEDARQLRARIATVDLTPAALLDGAIGVVEDIAARKLDGAEERYAKTDLWDIEANLDGVREITAQLQPIYQLQNADVFAQAASRYAEIDAVLDRYKEACGFKSFDAVSRDDRMALKRSTSALAAELSTLRGAVAMN